MMEKGAGILLRAIPLVLSKYRDVRFIFAGDWFTEGFKDECLDYVSSQNIDEAIEFKGLVTGRTKIQTLFDADIFVFPPIAPEGMPWVILEAMAARLPIVSTPQGAIPEVVVDGETGYIVESGNPGALAEKILALLHDNRLRVGMGDKGKERLDALYREDKYIGNLTKVFHEVVNET
jgi:glycosyltransferase involved in cell wall biosynthesis